MEMIKVNYPKCNGNRYLWNNHTGKPGYECAIYDT